MRRAWLRRLCAGWWCGLHGRWGRHVHRQHHLEIQGDACATVALARPASHVADLSLCAALLRTTVRATWSACNICDTEASNVRVGRGINATRASACEGKCRQLRCGADCGGLGYVGCAQEGGVLRVYDGAVTFIGGTISNTSAVRKRLPRFHVACRVLQILMLYAALLRTTVRATWCACNIFDTEASNVGMTHSVPQCRRGVACELSVACCNTLCVRCCAVWFGRWRARCVAGMLPCVLYVVCCMLRAVERSQLRFRNYCVKA